MTKKEILEMLNRKEFWKPHCLLNYVLDFDPDGVLERRPGALNDFILQYDLPIDWGRLKKLRAYIWEEPSIRWDLRDLIIETQDEDATRKFLYLAYCDIDLWLSPETEQFKDLAEELVTLENFGPLTPTEITKFLVHCRNIEEFQELEAAGVKIDWLVVWDKVRNDYDCLPDNLLHEDCELVDWEITELADIVRNNPQLFGRFVEMIQDEEDCQRLLELFYKNDIIWDLLDKTYSPRLVKFFKKKQEEKEEEDEE